MLGTHVVRSVLGDTREAPIHGTDEHPWITCPFCSSAVYLRDPFPEHENASISRDGICRNPWCIANPKLTLDSARQARGEEMLREMSEQARARDHASAMRRIAQERLDREESARQRAEEAREHDACVPCAVRFGKIIRHRAGCPKLRKIPKV